MTTFHDLGDKLLVNLEDADEEEKSRLRAIHAAWMSMTIADIRAWLAIEGFDNQLAWMERRAFGDAKVDS